MAATIDIADHPSNLDPTARIVFEDRARRIDIYSVRGGFLATRYWPEPGALPGLYPSKDAAYNAAIDTWGVAP